LPERIIDSASFLTRLRQYSSSSVLDVAQGAFSRSNSKVSCSVQSGSFSSWLTANLMRSRLRCWKRAKMAKAGSTSPLRIMSSKRSLYCSKSAMSDASKLVCWLSMLSRKRV
jgi:hypothetical protein